MSTQKQKTPRPRPRPRPLGLNITHDPILGSCLGIPLSQLGLKARGFRRILVPIREITKPIEVLLPGDHRIELTVGKRRIGLTFEVMANNGTAAFGQVKAWCPNGFKMVGETIEAAMRQGACTI